MKEKMIYFTVGVFLWALFLPMVMFLWKFIYFMEENQFEIWWICILWLFTVPMTTVIIFLMRGLKK